jgi:hypothetical protein
MKELALPKKVHGRSASKTKTRTRTAPARPLAVPVQADATQDELIPSTTPSRGTSTSAAAPSTRSGAAATAARRAVASRRTPALTINYDYLRGDIRMLSVLAPSMVVLLVIAFFALH